MEVREEEGIGGEETGACGSPAVEEVGEGRSTRPQVRPGGRKRWSRRRRKSRKKEEEEEKQEEMI